MIVHRGEAVVHGLVAKCTAAFLKTELAGEAGYQNMLTPGWALTKEPLVEFFVTEKRNANSISEDWPGEYAYFPHQPGSVQAKALKDAVPKQPQRRLGQP